MTVHYKTEGFVFKSVDRLEADRVFSVFTVDFGRIEVFGKSIRKIEVLAFWQALKDYVQQGAFHHGAALAYYTLFAFIPILIPVNLIFID